MLGLEALREQHDAAMAMADRLLELANRYAPPQPVYPIVMQLNRLHGLLRVHLAHEDVDLYPHLIASSDPTVARAAQHFVDEMGGLAAEFEQFARYWSCSASIAGSFDEFREGLHELMLRLAVRIERENLWLYPVARAETSRRDAA